MPRADVTELLRLGPRTAAHLRKHMEKHGQLPSGFLDRWARAKRVEETDRIYHGLGVLVDQLNLGSLAMAEILARRLRAIFDAFGHSATKPNFESARFFDGFGAATGAVSPELRSFAARRARDEGEIEESRQKARESKGPAGRS